MSSKKDVPPSLEDSGIDVENTFKMSSLDQVAPVISVDHDESDEFVIPDIQTFAPQDTHMGTEETAEAAETTISTFSSTSCSYLSPFSTTAAFIVLGGEECDADEIFITPKNLPQPEISVQPPTPLMPRTTDPLSVEGSRSPKKKGVFSKLCEAANTITIAPMMNSPDNNNDLAPDPFTPHHFRRAMSEGHKRYMLRMSSPAPNLPAFDKIDIQGMMRQDRSCSEGQQLPSPNLVRSTGIRKTGSFDLQSRKISLDIQSGRFCRPNDQSFILKKRSYSTTEAVSEMEVKKDGGSKIWRQLKGTGILVGRVASVLSNLNTRKNKHPSETKQDFSSTCKFIRNIKQVLYFDKP